MLRRPAVHLIAVLAFLGICLCATDAGATSFGNALTPISRLVGGIVRDVTVSGDYAYCAADGVVLVLDVSTPASPQLVGYWDNPMYATGIAVYNGYVYVVTRYGGLCVLDVSDPTNPTRIGALGSSEVGNDCQAVRVVSGYAYIAARNDGLVIVDISDPSAPVKVGQFDTAGSAYAVAIGGGYAFVADGSNGLVIVDVTDRANPSLLATLSLPGTAKAIAVTRDYAYVGCGYSGVQVVSIIIRSNPVAAGSASSTGDVQAVAYSSSKVYAAAGSSGLQVINVASPSAPATLAYEDTPGSACGIDLDAGAAYIADAQCGVRVMDVSTPAAPAEIGRFDQPGSATAAQVSGDYAYVADFQGGLRVVNLSDPAHPAQVGAWISGKYANEVVVSGAYAYVAEGVGGLAVVNIASPTNPFLVTRLQPSGSAQAIAKAGSVVYIGATDGLHVVNASTPSTPVETGTWNSTEWVLDVALQGAYAYVANKANGLRVLDVSNPVAPVEVGSYVGVADINCVAVEGDYAYVGDAWGYLTVLDISNPAAPTMVGQLAATSTANAIVKHGRLVYVVSDLMGLRVVDVGDPAHPTAAAYCEGQGSAKGVAIGASLVLVCDYGCGLTLLDVPASIAGQVRDQTTSTPLAGATVSYTGGGTQNSAVTGANGIYFVAAVNPGTYTLAAAAAGHLTQIKANIGAPADSTTYVNFSLGNSGRVSGQVRCIGSEWNLVGAAVKLYRNGALAGSCVTGSNGIYVYDSNLPTGAYVVTASLNGFATQTKRNIAVTAGATTYVNFALDWLSLKGQVKASGGGPLAGATVTASHLGEVVATATTDASGVYQIVHLYDSTHDLVASKPGYVRQSKPGIATAVYATTYVNFSLAVSGKLRGQVKASASGTPIIGATVEARLNGVLRATGVTVAPYGVYEIPSDLPAGAYVVKAIKEGYTAQVKSNIGVTPGVTTNVNFSLTTP